MVNSLWALALFNVLGKAFAAGMELGDSLMRSRCLNISADPIRALNIFNERKPYRESRAARMRHIREEVAHHQQRGETAAGTRLSCARAPARADSC